MQTEFPFNSIAPARRQFFIPRWSGGRIKEHTHRIATLAHSHTHTSYRFRFYSTNCWYPRAHTHTLTPTQTHTYTHKPRQLVFRWTSCPAGRSSCFVSALSFCRFYKGPLSLRSVAQLLHTSRRVRYASIWTNS